MHDAHTLPPGWTTTQRAILSPSGRYRYWLRRSVGGLLSSRKAVFCMLNPSTADATNDDPTIRRCMAFARAWGCGEMAVVNLFAMRSTDPAVLFATGVTDPEGPDNDTIVLRVAQFCAEEDGVFVCAWGSAGKTKAEKQFVAYRAETVRGLIEGQGCKPHVLRLSEKTGQPWHPLYLPAGLNPTPWVDGA